jgi:di/tricarboxylate transporter
MAETMGVSSRPFLVAVAFAASACFTSPIGYQTNLMVYGPGRFRFIDFIKVGAPLNLMFLVISVFVIPLVWSF